MSDTPFSEIERLFQAAADRPAAEREAFVRRESGEDAELARRVLDLVRRFEEGTSLERPLPDRRPPLSEDVGTVIDRYRLLERIGEGGFGVVYMAEQQEPVTRRVALKIVKVGMDTREVVARFEAERQALALMDHPHIARVLDGGATAAGRPYFVMELVRGVPITEYCDQNRLSPRERIELLLPVCHAVQHAHQKGVIHRDLKPSNVMVTLHDGRPVPKVIDFGIAKAMHTRLTQKTLFTRFEQFVGTPAYMSPEQAEMSALDVDTRTDIYALGVLLYELLTGTTPFDPRALWDAGLSEMQRVIREQVPQRPSQRISTTHDATICERRRLDVQALQRSLKGDLDWIVLKTLEKDRQRRYASASELADDLRRHLADEPVLASPPGRLYRARKFVARNRALVVSGTLVLLALLLAVVGTSLGMREAARQRDVARAEARNVKEVTQFLIGVLSLADPQFALAPDLSVRQLLDRAAADVGGALEDQPEAEARVRTSIGQAYLSLGQHEEAERHLERAVKLWDSLDQPDLGTLYAGLWALTNVAFKIERPDAFAWAGRARQVGLDHVAASHPELARLLREFTKKVEDSAQRPGSASLLDARGMVPECLRVARASLAPRDPLWPIVAETFMAAGYWTWYTPNEEVGATFFEAAREIQEREMEPGHPAAAESLALLVGVLNRAGRAAEAEDRIRKAVEELRQVLPEDNFQRAFVESMLGDNLAGQGKFEEAESLLKPAHEILTSQVAADTHFYAVDSFTRMVNLYDLWQRPEEARPYREELARRLASGSAALSWPLTYKAFPPEHRELVECITEVHDALGGISFSLTPPEVSARPVADTLERLLESARRHLGESPDLATLVARMLLSLSHGVEEPEIRLAMVSHAHGVFAAQEAPVVVERACAAACLAELQRLQGNATAAESLAREAAAWIRRDTAEDTWFSSVEKARIGDALAAAGLFAEAEALLLRAHACIESQLGPAHRESKAAAAKLARLYRSWGRPEQAEQWEARAR